MREIKFKNYDTFKKEKTFIYRIKDIIRYGWRACEYHYSDGKNLKKSILKNKELVNQVNKYFSLGKGITVMSTGLFDKNDVEIYDGDILAYEEGEDIYVVGFVNYCDDPKCEYAGSYYLEDDSECAVERLVSCNDYIILGNIYENPELLDEKTH